MPMDHITRSGAGGKPLARPLAPLALVALLLAGCGGGGAGDGGIASRMNLRPADAASEKRNTYPPEHCGSFENMHSFGSVKLIPFI